MRLPADAGPVEAVAPGRPDSPVEQLRDAQWAIQDRLEQIQDGYAMLTEAMAAAAHRLAVAAQEADFSPPPWPDGIGRTIEIRLAETREVVLRMGTGPYDSHGRPV